MIMGAILSTLTSVSLHYDHSPLALPMEVEHYHHLSSLVVKVILFKVKFWFLLYNRLPLYSFCIPFVQVFQFDFNPIQSYFLNPIVFLLLSNSLYIKLSQVFNPLIIIFFFSKILRCSIGLALVMVTGGWKASNIFIISPSFLFFSSCHRFVWAEDKQHQPFSFFSSFLLAFCFWWLASNIVQI